MKLKNDQRVRDEEAIAVNDPTEWSERQCMIVLSDSKKSKFWKWHAARRLVCIHAPPPPDDAD
jgi:hypothetical protein